MDEVWVPPEIDTTVAHPARRYDYWLGGKDNYAADRASAEAVLEIFPTIRTTAIENRGFLSRAVEFLVREAGIDQFLDIGTGIPAANNTHEVAQRINPATRVVYVDNDPIVLAHARALLTSTHPAGITAYLDADLREPDDILTDRALADTLDLSRPVALMLVAILHFFGDDDRPLDVVARLLDALPDGSYVVISHATGDFVSAELRGTGEEAMSTPKTPFRLRTREEITRLFHGHELVDPGIVVVSEWRAGDEPPPRPSEVEVSTYGGVARIARPGR